MYYRHEDEAHNEFKVRGTVAYMDHLLIRAVVVGKEKHVGGPPIVLDFTDGVIPKWNFRAQSNYHLMGHAVQCASIYAGSMHNAEIFLPIFLMTHSDQYPPSQLNILVTTPNTFVFASLNSINCPSLRNSVWLMNSNTTLDRSPVRIKPEGWSRDSIRTVCCTDQLSFLEGVRGDIPEWRRSASLPGTWAE